jgi:hypothetical protein
MVFLVFSERRETSSEDRWTTRRVTAQDVDDYPGGSGPAPPDCDPATPHAFLTFAQGTPGNAATLCAPSPLEPAGNIVAGSCAGVQAITRVVFASQVRYRIRTETDGVPVLQRSSTDDPTGGFQTLARGIEELQVQYTQVNDPGVWLDGAPVVADPALPPADAPNFGTLVNQVRVTLTSRSEAQNIQGVSAGASGPARLRGSLTSTSAPRATLMHLARGRPSPMPSPGTWYWE